MKLSIVMIILILFFNACSQKEVEPKVIIKKELVCVKWYTIARPHAKIKIHKAKENVELAKAYKEAVNQGFETYEKQIERYKKICVPKVGSADNEDNSKME